MRHPGAILANQFHNPANPQAHYETTGPEIWAQTEGRVTHFLAGSGTGGTISGVGRYLKEQNPDVQIVGVDPEGSILRAFFDTGELTAAEPYKVEGIGSDKIPGALDMSVTDRWITVTDAESFAMTRRVAREDPGLSEDALGDVLVHSEGASEHAAPGVCDSAEVVFPALHGGMGEDGTLQALLDLGGVAYAGSGMLGCALAMDKDVTKRILREAGIRTPDWLVNPTAAAAVERLGLPIIAKPVAGGSSSR